MRTLQEIKLAIANLGPREKALLTAELFAEGPVPNTMELESALDRGLRDVQEGRVRPLEEAKDQLKRWASKS